MGFCDCVVMVDPPGVLFIIGVKKQACAK